MPYAEAEGLVSYHVRRAQQMHTQAWMRHVHPEISGGQYAVLAALAERDDLSLRELGGLVHLDKSTLSELVRRMAGRGWLEIAHDPDDRRRRLVRMSQAGRALREELRPRVLALNELLLEGLDEAERAALYSSLRALQRTPLALGIEAELEASRGEASPRRRPPRGAATRSA